MPRLGRSPLYSSGMDRRRPVSLGHVQIREEAASKPVSPQTS